MEFKINKINSLILMLLMSSFSYAASPTSGNSQGHNMRNESHSPMGHRGPPPEAIKACSSASAGTACSFTGGRGENVSGTCFTPEQSKPLACKPTNPPNMAPMNKNMPQGNQNSQPPKK